MWDRRTSESSILSGSWVNRGKKREDRGTEFEGLCPPADNLRLPDDYCPFSAVRQLSLAQFFSAFRREAKPDGGVATW